MKTTYKFISILLLLTLFSCSKKDEIEETTPQKDFTIQTTSNFLSSNQKAYYFVTTLEEELLEEGVLENNSTYSLEINDTIQINLNYIIRTQSGDITYFEGYTFLNISKQETLIFHKNLSNQTTSLNKINLGTLKATMDCVNDIDYFRYSVFSDYSSFHSHYDGSNPPTLKAYSESDEAMLLLSDGYRISDPQDFSYKMINLKARQNQDFSCQDASLINGREIMKSIDIRAAEAKKINSIDDYKAMEIYTFPTNQQMMNYNPNPYLSTSTGLIERRTMVTSHLDDYKIWYPTIWIENQREHMEVVVDIFKEEGSQVEQYIQKNYGNYPPPSDIIFEVPSTNTQVRHRGSTTTIFQSGEHYLLQIEYKKRNFNPSDIQIYTWKLNLDSKKTELEWTVPSFSQQAADYLSLDKDFYRNNMIPVMSYFEVEEGVNYDSYVDTYFTDSNPFIFKNMDKWRTTWFTRKSL